MWAPHPQPYLRSRRTITPLPERIPMHGSLHMIVANESIRTRQADAAAARSRSRGSLRRPVGAMVARLRGNRAPAPGIPTRAAPGSESRSPLGHTAAAPLRGR